MKTLSKILVILLILSLNYGTAYSQTKPPAVKLKTPPTLPPPKTTTTKATETKPTETKQVETKPTEAKPTDTKPAVQSPVTSPIKATPLPTLNLNPTPPPNAPAREINCFKNFNVNAVGRSDINAYLLSLLSYYIYADQLAKETAFIKPGAGETKLQQDDKRFEAEFINRTRHFFYDANNTIGPQYFFATASNDIGIDPEIMLISTNNAVYVVVRGTDRVGGANGNFLYNVGEWLVTDFRFLFTQAFNGSAEQVHRGFFNALAYEPGTKGAPLTQNEQMTDASFIKVVSRKIKEMIGTSNKKVWITGHSLGSAIAQLTGFYLKRDQIDVQGMMLFAAPHPGNVAFCNTLNTMFQGPEKAGQRIQRYDFIEDPITKLAGRDLCAPGTALCYGHAGVRNHIAFASGPNHIKFDAGERGIDMTLGTMTNLISGGLTGFGGSCWHNPQWYVGACFNQLSASVKAKVPAPPALPTTSFPGCSNNPFDINLGTSGNYFDPGSATIAPGTYTIKTANGGSGKGSTSKFIIAGKRDCPINLNNCCPAIQNTNAIETDDNKWIISEVDGLLKSYTLTNKKFNTVLDADAVCGNSDGCKVQHCNRIASIAGFRTNQEWAFRELPNGHYKLRCTAGDKFLRIDPNNNKKNTSDECPFVLWSDLDQNDQEFILTKVSDTPAAPDPVGDAVDAAVEIFWNAVTAVENLADNVILGTHDGEYKIICAGFQNSPKKFLKWNGTIGSQLTISSTGSNFQFTKKATGGYQISRGSNSEKANISANVTFNNLGLPTGTQVNNNVFMRKDDGIVGDEETWYILKVPNVADAYVLYNWNTKKVLDAPNDCNNGGECGLNERTATSNSATQVWLLKKQ